MAVMLNGKETVYFGASGCLGYDYLWPYQRLLAKIGVWDPSLLMPVAKTVTLAGRTGNWNGNPYHCIRPSTLKRHVFPNGTTNFIGLSGPNFKTWMRQVGSQIMDGRINPVISILGTPDELALMATQLAAFAKVLRPLGIKIVVEINASCPNTKDCDVLANNQRVIDGCRVVWEILNPLGIPIILKLSVVHDIWMIVPKVDAWVVAYSVNSVPWRETFPDRDSPLAFLGGEGGVSGSDAQLKTWSFAVMIKSLAKKPVITPSIWRYEDIRQLRDFFGIDEFSFGALALLYPWRVTSIIRQDMRTQSTPQTAPA